jgi:membrane protein
MRKMFLQTKGYLQYFGSLLYAVLIKPLILLAEKIRYPGEEHVSLAHIARFFLTGIRKGGIQMRASAISFDFFLAIFPTIIFFFTLLPYIPIDGFQDRILEYMRDIMPDNTYETAGSTIEDILKQQRGGLLSFGFLFAVFVSTNGVNSMLDGFNKSYHGIAVRTGFRQWVTALSLTILVAVIVIFSIALIIFSEIASGYLSSAHLVNAGTQIFLLRSLTYAILFTAALMTISCLYYYGPSKKNRRPFISVGSVTATLLLAMTSIAFNYFVSNFSQHNKIYGSIGTLIVILIWINFNTLQLLIGFELNASIENALKSPAPAKKGQSEKDEPIHRSL